MRNTMDQEEWEVEARVAYLIFWLMRRSRCSENVLMALSTLKISWASLLERSNPKAASKCTTTCTESRESIPRSWNLEVLVISEGSHFVDCRTTYNTLLSTSSFIHACFEVDNKALGWWLNLNIIKVLLGPLRNVRSICQQFHNLFLLL